MTTNSPNPVDGDVQALIEHIKEVLQEYEEHGGIGYGEAVYRTALAALTAEPVAYTDAEELETLRKGTFADMFTPHESYKADQLWIPLYTTPPAQLLRPVELPGGFSPAIGDIFDRQAPVMRRDKEDGQWLHKAVVKELIRSLGHEVKE